MATFRWRKEYYDEAYENEESESEKNASEAGEAQNAKMAGMRRHDADSACGIDRDS